MTTMSGTRPAEAREDAQAIRERNFVERYRAAVSAERMAWQEVESAKAYAKSKVEEHKRTVSLLSRLLDPTADAEQLELDVTGNSDDDEDDRWDAGQDTVGDDHTQAGEATPAEEAAFDAARDLDATYGPDAPTDGAEEGVVEIRLLTATGEDSQVVARGRRGRKRISSDDEEAE